MDVLGKIKQYILKIDQSLPDNWKYYAETAIGLILTVSAVGSLFVPPTSTVSGIAFLLTGLYTIPDIRFRVLYRLDIRPPRYSVVIILLLGLMIGGSFSPQVSSQSSSAEFTTLSSNLNIEENRPVKTVTGTAEVQNQGGVPGNYSVGLSIDGALVNQSTVTLESGETRSFSFSADLEEEGDHQIKFYSSTTVLDGSSTNGFQIEDTATVPHYLNSENVREVVQSYSRMTNKDLSNIQEIDVSSSESDTEISLTNKVRITGGLYDLFSTATANSFFASKKIFQEFDNVAYVSTNTRADYTYPNGTVEERTIFETGLSREDADSISWDNATAVIRTNSPYWLNLTSRYRVHSDLCEALSSDVECSK